MTKHTLDSSHIVRADPQRVWAFFSRRRNLGRITPRSMRFGIPHRSAIDRGGLTIEYTLRPLFGIPVQWRTLIDEVEARHRFRDVQEKGPYKSWLHQHRFTAVEDGVRMDDRVEYEMPFGPVGALGHRMLVRSQLQHVFDFRASAIDSIFEPAGDRQGAMPGTILVAGGSGFVGGRDRPGSCAVADATSSSSPPGARARAASSPTTSRCAPATSVTPTACGPRSPAWTSWSSRWPSRACPSSNPGRATPSPRSMPVVPSA